MATNSLLGDLLAHELEVFRAFSNRNFLDSSKALRDRAYLRRRKDLDGLSVGTAPRNAVEHLAENFGVSGLIVGRIHGLNRGLETRYDLTIEGHVLICNLPYEHENRELAETIAWELVWISRIVYSESYDPDQETT